MSLYLFLAWLAVMACTTVSAKIITALTALGFLSGYILLKKIIKKIK